MEIIPTTRFRNVEPAWHSSVVPMELEFQADPIFDCPVCLYWFERLETSRTDAPSPSEAIREEKRLLAILRQHQVEGACVRRLPHLMELLMEREETPGPKEIGGNDIET